MKFCVSVMCIEFCNCIRVDIYSEESLTPYGCCLNYSRSTFVLHLRRKYLYYVIHLILPYCLFSVIAVFTLVLQPSRPERLNLGMVHQFRLINKSKLGLLRAKWPTSMKATRFCIIDKNLTDVREHQRDRHLIKGPTLQAKRLCSFSIADE